MLILLPPSETKRTGGTGRLDETSLSHAALLGDARRLVRRALEILSDDEVAAAKALKLGVKNRDELLHNSALGASGVMPAVERYSGVLYDALDAVTLDPAARAWVDRSVLVQSALFGLIRASDEIPAYRLSAGSSLPELGAPLKRVWGGAHREVIDGLAANFLLDLRSKDYGALAPLPSGVGHFLNVVQRGEDGEVRALNHFNKAAKGDLVRRLARSGPRIENAGQLIDWATAEGLEMSARAPSEGGDAEIVLVTELGPPLVRAKRVKAAV